MVTAEDIMRQAGFATEPGSLPEEFWERPVLDHIRRAAHSRMVSAPAVLHAILARIAGATPHNVKLPAIVGGQVGLSYFTAFAGPSGDGKSSANAVAVELAPVDWNRIADQLPAGSGEGLIEVLFDVVEEDDPNGGRKPIKVKRQVRHNAIVYIDEGQALADLGGRKGSTLLPTIRTIWTGGVLGQTNASLERKRIVPAGQYTYGIVMAIQPQLAGALLDDVAAGTPQRFAWVEAIDPTVPDDQPAWPGTLKWRPLDVPRGELAHLVPIIIDVDPDIVHELRQAQLHRRRGQVRVDPLDAHAGLMQLKMAALLGLLDNRAQVNQEDWRLAGMLLNASNRVRDDVLGIVADEAANREAQTAKRLALRAVQTDEAVERRRIVDCARKLATKVWDGHEDWTRKDLYLAMRRHRDVFDDGLDHAIKEGWVDEHDVASHTGDDRREIRPGTRRPT
jgi:hypothetical protein